MQLLPVVVVVLCAIGSANARGYNYRPRKPSPILNGIRIRHPYPVPRFEGPRHLPVHPLPLPVPIVIKHHSRVVVVHRRRGGRGRRGSSSSFSSNGSSGGRRYRRRQNRRRSYRKRFYKRKYRKGSSSR